MTVHCFGRQFGWPKRLSGAAPAYLRNVGAAPPRGERRRMMTYDGRIDWLFGVSVWTWNIDSQK